MSDQQNKNTPEEQSNEIGQTPVPVHNEADKIKHEQCAANTESKQGESEQKPIYYKDVKKGWSKQERITLAGVVLNFIALIGLTISITQTIRVANIADSTFAINRIKDSITAQRYEMENRPLMQPVNIKPKVEVGKPILITFDISNMGKLPGKVLTGKIGSCYGKNLSKDSVDILSILIDYNYYISIVGNVVIPNNVNGIEMDAARYEYYKKRETSFYLVGEIVYESFINKDIKYTTKFMYQINSIPELRIVGMRNEDEKIPSFQ